MTRSRTAEKRERRRAMRNKEQRTCRLQRRPAAQRKEPAGQLGCTLTLHYHDRALHLTPLPAALSTPQGKFTMMNMFEDGRAPGDLGFDPLKFGENSATRERLEMAELKNGRLAMLAFSGMIHQTFVTGKPLWASTQEIFAPP